LSYGQPLLWCRLLSQLGACGGGGGGGWWWFGAPAAGPRRRFDLLGM